jgi:hypothetical protein
LRNQVKPYTVWFHCFLGEAATGNEKKNRQGQPDDTYQGQAAISLRELKELVPVTQYSNRYPNRHKKQERCLCEINNTHKTTILYHRLQMLPLSPNSDDNDSGLGQVRVHSTTAKSPYHSSSDYLQVS